MPTLTLYTKPDCSLCDEAHAALERVRERVPFDLELVDISADLELAERYGERIPVVLVDGEASLRVHGRRAALGKPPARELGAAG